MPVRITGETGKGILVDLPEKNPRTKYSRMKQANDSHKVSVINFVSLFQLLLLCSFIHFVKVKVKVKETNKAKSRVS